MKQFYNVFSNEKVSTMLTQLSWSHYLLLISLNDYNEIIYYIRVAKDNNLSQRQLQERIKNNEYKRLPIETRSKITNSKLLNIKDLVPNPILIKNKNNIDIINEKVLHQLILEDIESFMKELGNGFCFIGSEYKIKIGDNFHKIDLLLFNIKYNSYVVVELKVCELRKEHIGQIEVYMNYIDKNIKRISQDKTIGIIICRKNNEYLIEYCSYNRIISREYVLV